MSDSVGSQMRGGALRAGTPVASVISLRDEQRGVLLRVRQTGV